MLEVKTYLSRQRIEKPRGMRIDESAARRAAEIIDDVRSGRTRFLPRVSEQEIAAARTKAPEAFLASLSIARVNIRRFHECQRRSAFTHENGDGMRIARQMRPIGRAGILCGRSFMALLMAAVPAQVAGVRQIAVAAAPDGNGSVDPKILATARSLGIDEVYPATGAEAVAAFAFGALPAGQNAAGQNAGAIRRVDKIVGSSDPLAAAAKRALSHIVGTDGERSRGELVVVADGTANARFIALDLLAQAEHGAGALALLTDDRALAESVRIETGRLSESLPLPDREMILDTLSDCGAIYLLPSLDAAIDAANAIAPARLSLQTAENDRWLPGIETAGAVFVGPWAAEMTGDFFAGVNSFLPAGGTARFASGLGVDDFTREMPVVECDPARLAETGLHLVRLAEEEERPAHAEAIRERLEFLHQTV